ncbi:MAG: hypothetical protein KJ044_13880 [Planctomycetes bacterium]|nr:hypothetical protein [Planctomycetota bacterium]
MDRTADTAYRLASVAQRLVDADHFDAQGNRSEAASLLVAARDALPADHARERHYLCALLAAVWGRYGDGRDEIRALAFLADARAGTAADARLAGDVYLAETAVCLGREDAAAALTAGRAALDSLGSVQAWVRYADVCRELGAGYFDHGLRAEAAEVSRRGAEIAEELDEHIRALRSWLDLGQYLPPEQPAAMDEAFLRAYSAAYRVGRLAWRSVVIATAVDALFSAGHMALAGRWGDRLRDGEGRWPDASSAGMHADDWAFLTGRYALALFASRRADTRLAGALRTAIAALQPLMEGDTEASDLHDRARAALLQMEKGK